MSSQARFRRRTARRLPLKLENLEPRTLLAADVIINELMASNQSTLVALDGSYPDWIELHNRGDEAVNLAGWQLRDPGAHWTFPEWTLGSGEYLIVFASGDDKVITQPVVEFHTNFKLKKEGEYVGLLRPDSSIAHEYNPFPEQLEDGSFGLSRNDNFAQYFSQPTPGAENPPAPTVMITEFMAVNQGTLADEDGDFADWIELHNAGDGPANLNGWILEDWSAQWEFPEVVIGPGEYLVVFASANDRREIERPLHTNFKLAGEGDRLALRRTDGVVVSEFVFPEQRTDVSFGLTIDGAERQYFETPTPARPNATGYQGVRFTQGSGFYDSSVGVTLTTELEGASIRYTTDGTVPTAMHGTLYERPVRIDHSTVIRAAAFRDDIVPVVSTRSFLVREQIPRQSGDGLPQTWGFVADYEMDPDVVSQDPSLIQAWYDLPTVSLAIPPDDLFSIQNGIFAHPLMEGDEWQRAVSIEFLPPSYEDNTQRLAADGKLGTIGQQGERNPAITSKFSLGVSFDEPLEPADVGRKLFEETPVDRLAGLNFRAGYADSWLSSQGEQRQRAAMARSQFVLETQRAMGQPAISSRFVNLFINGLYWGVYDMTQQPGAPLAAELLGGAAADYDVITASGVIDGNSEAWDVLMTAANADLSEPAAYQAVANLVDMRNLIDFLILKRYAQIGDAVPDSWFTARNGAPMLALPSFSTTMRSRWALAASLIRVARPSTRPSFCSNSSRIQRCFAASSATAYSSI